MPLADLYLRMKRRKECLEVLAEAGLKIKVFGNGWAKTSFAENFEIHPAVKFDELLKLVAKSKIVLNIVPSFVEGSHERVFTAMLNGAVALTDRNKYYEKEFKEGSNIVFYSWDNLTELPDRLNDLLCDQERLNFIAAEGKKVALQKHTWTVRALALLEMAKNYKWLRKIS